LERLNEEQDKTSSIRGKVLVSCVQHDAVENIINRLNINALPAIKFGGKLGETQNSVTDRIDEFCNNISQCIHNKNPNISQTVEQKQLLELFTLYASSPSISNAINLLKRVQNLPLELITQSLQDKAYQLLELLAIETESDPVKNSKKLKIIRGLRTTEAGFLDDGKEKSKNIFKYFESDLNASEQDTLINKAYLFKNGNKLDFLEELKNIKRKLIDLYTTKPMFRMNKPREDILSFFSQVSKQLKKKKSSTDVKEGILSELLHELNDNPDGIKEAISGYNFVFAATTQQAAGDPIIKAKAKEANDYEQKIKSALEYDTVIVDEAARTSPRDLLIPMSQAKNRIILVGDHRQLPHLIDQEVVEELKSNTDNSEQDFVEKSMFQYLFKRLEKLEQKDGIQRTVTLNAQYRTHPLLGQFVSDNFYEIHDKREAFISPLHEDKFIQNLKKTNGKAALWLDVPNSEGNQQKPVTSWCRPIEAKKIVEQMKQWLDSKEGKNLTFGVISFYSEQVNCINDELVRNNIAEKSKEDGSYKIKQKYKYVEHTEGNENNSEERIKVGSVDSFQGMEFDIVFLSVVRTQNYKRLKNY